MKVSTYPKNKKASVVAKEPISLQWHKDIGQNRTQISNSPMIVQSPSLSYFLKNMAYMEMNYLTFHLLFVLELKIKIKWLSRLRPWLAALFLSDISDHCFRRVTKRSLRGQWTIFSDTNQDGFDIVYDAGGEFCLLPGGKHRKGERSARPSNEVFTSKLFLRAD